MRGEGSVLTATVILISLSLAASCSTSSNSTATTPRTSAATGSAVSPSPSGVSQSPYVPPSVVSEPMTALGGAWPQGSDIRFSVPGFVFPGLICWMNTYTWHHHTAAAYESDCPDWAANGHDVLIFYVEIQNTSPSPVELRLKNFVLKGRDGRTFSPIDVRSIVPYPQHFLAEAQKLPQGGDWKGFVVFKGGMAHFIAASLSYIDGKQRLEQVFEGRHGLVAPR